MSEPLEGFPFWPVAFDAHGVAAGDGADALVRELPGAGLTDLFVLCHGWNNDAAMAKSLYERLLAQMRPLAASTTIGAAGIFWPSMRWPDEEIPVVRAGGAASLDGARDLFADLRATYADPAQRASLAEIADLLDRRPSGREPLERFQRLLGTLAAAPDAADTHEDGGERALLEGDPLQVFEESAQLAPPEFQGGAVGLGDGVRRLWAGARQGLRQVTYWTMKKRAGVVGAEGLGPLLGRLAAADGALRVHLVGHSFGARLVSYSLRGLPDGSRPVRSLLLLQGAFSHFAFAPALPHDRTRAGALAGMPERVAGPVLVTHSGFDLAVGELYPWASIVGRDDAAAREEPLYRWGAMGHDGAQASDAVAGFLLRDGDYGFEPGRIYNLDANAVIRTGEPPSGAHSDIFHPEVARAALSGAGLL